MGLIFLWALTFSSIHGSNDLKERPNESKKALAQWEPKFHGPFQREAYNERARKFWKGQGSWDLRGKRERMMTAHPWRPYVLLVLAISIPLLLFESLFSHHIFVNRARPRIKRFAELPLRFRYDGTFKILQVGLVSFFFFG